MNTNQRHIKLFLVLLTALFALQCQENGTVNPIGPPLRLLIIEGLAAMPNRVSAGGAESVITGRVVDQDDSPYTGVQVDFRAGQGTVIAADTTDGTGAFQTIFHSSDTPGTDTVFISVGDESAIVPITITGSSAELTLRLSNVSVLANGLDTTLVTANIVGRTGPINRIPVRFETSAGSFTGQRVTFAQTDIDGKAVVILTSSSSTTTVTATVTASIEDVESSPPAIGPGGRPRPLSGDYEETLPRVSERMRKALLHRPSGANAEASIPITFRGVTIAVEASPELIPGDGQSTSEIRAFVKEDNLQAVPNARVTFSARLGSIPVLGITDGAGVARVTLTSAAIPGITDRVVARYGPQLADSVEVAYASAVGRIVLTAGAPSFRADGTSGVDIEARVFGGTGQVAPGIEVFFSVDTGFVFPDRAMTDNDGLASTRLTGPGSASDLRITVRGEVIEAASSEATLPSRALRSEPFSEKPLPEVVLPGVRSAPPGGQDIAFGKEILREALPVPKVVETPTSVESSVTVTARGLQLRLAAAPDSIVARDGSTSSLSARVFETTSGNPVGGDTVRFATTFGSIPGSAILDADGIARVTFTAGNEVGRAAITARYGVGHEVQTVIELLPLIGSVTLESDRPALRAGGIDRAQITAQLFDPLGTPAPGVPLFFSADSRPGESVRVVTDDRGLAEYTVISPALEADSALRVTVEAGELSESIRLSVRALARLISANPDSLSAGSRAPATISFQAFERTTRRPVAGDTVWFSGFGGVVQPFAVLDAQGVARTTFAAAADPGEAWVAGQLGELPPDTTRLVLVEPIANISVVSGRRSILANGVDTTAITARVTNLLGQPSASIWVSFQSSAGTIIPNAAQTDSNGFARAAFTSQADDRDNRAEIAVRAIEEQLLASRSTVSPKVTTPQKRGSIRNLRGIPALAEEPRRGGLRAPSDSVTPDDQLKSLTPQGFDDAFDTLFVEMRGVALALRASPGFVRADGRSRAGINIQLNETTSGAAIAGARLRLGATLGAIAAEGLTRNDGTFTDSLTTGVSPGLSIVRVTYGDEIVSADTIVFTPDPARQNLVFLTEPQEAIAGSNARIRLRTRVLDSDGAPSGGIGVTFTLEGSIWALIDPNETREVVRYENTFRLDNRDIVTSLRLQTQLRGVESGGTQILLNRSALDTDLPQGDLWGEYVLALPVERLLDGVNRIEIVGGQQDGVSDRFSIAGIRLGLVGSHPLGEEVTDDEGWAEIEWPVDRVAGAVIFRAALRDAPQRFLQRSIRLNPAAAALIRVSTAADTLLANGAEESALLALVTDAEGNPAAGGFRVNFASELGRIRPETAQTLGDGTASAIYTAPASEQDEQAVLTATGEGAEGSWDLLLRGARLRLTLPDARMLADGSTQMEVRARLSTADGAAVPGRRIDFRTTRGAITPSVQTGNDGVALAMLTAADIADTATITATFGPEISASAEVIFVPLIESVELSSNPASMRADGLDSTTVSVTVTDGLGRGASGVRIDLEANRGRLSTRRIVTDNNGTASAKVFGTALAEDDSLRVVAATSGGAHRDTLFIRLRGVTLTVESDSDSLAANGVATAEITARVIETSTGNPVPSGRVTFSTDLGGITASANLSDNGIATANYTASPTVGEATVRAIYGGGLAATVSILLVDRVSALELTVAPGLILANGVQAATLVARVTDSWGEGAPSEPVTFNFEGAGSVTPNVGITNANGELRALARATASSSDGTLIVTASVRNGRLVETVPIEIRGLTIQVAADPTLIAGDGRATSTITARLRHTTTGNPVAGDSIRFSTSAGVIPPLLITNEDGEASVTLRSDPRSTIATVVAAHGNRLADTVRVAFAGRFSFLDLSLDRATILADGLDSVRATATILDTLRRPVSGITVSFARIGDVGTVLADSAQTDANGRAIVIYRSSPSVDDLTGSMRAFTGDLADTATVELRGVTLSVIASPDSIPANGVATSRLTARARETTSGNPVRGRVIAFRANAGVIAASSTTSEQGEASVNLRAAEEPATSTVTAEIGRGMIAQRRVVFIPTVGSLTIELGRERLLGEGVDTTIIVATLVDGARNPAPDVLLTFGAPDGGSLSDVEVVTDEDGKASAIYTTPALNDDTEIRVTALASGGAAAQATLAVVGLTVELSANPTRLPANGRATSTVTASITETTRHTPLEGRIVRFSADRGRIGAEAETDSSGLARVVFTAPNRPGDALIEAEFGDVLAASLELPCAASTPQTAVLTIDPASVSVAGVGRDDRATLSVIARDAAGNLVADESPIELRIDPSLGSRFENDLDTLVVLTTAGVAQANVRSGDTPGTVRFLAFSDGRQIAAGGELTVRSGPPARLRVRADISTIHRPAGGVTAFPVSAVVSDRFGNPVEDGTTVRFSLRPDDIGNISGEGETMGGVVSTPVDPIDYPTGIWLTYTDDEAGEEVWIRARSGEDVVDSTRVVLPGALQGGEPDRMEAGLDSLSLEADGVSTSLLTINLIDADGRPVADMTEVTLSADLGVIQTPRFTAEGTATATYRAGRVTGIDTIRIASGAIEDFVTLRLRPGVPERLTLTAARNELRADSSDNTIITVTVRDRFNNIVQPGTAVFFFTTLGSIGGFQETDQNGEARTRLLSARQSGTAVVRAIVGDADAITTVDFVSGDAANVVFIGSDRNTVGVRGSGQPETATLTFEVRDDRGVAVDRTHPVFVRFILDGPDVVIDHELSGADSVATLSPDSVETDERGRVTVTLRAGYFSGVVEITARTGEQIRGQAIAVAIRGGPPDVNHFSIIPSRCTTTGIFGTPPDTATVSVSVGDRFSNPVTPGTVVHFRTTGGVIEGSAETDTLGIAQVLLRTSEPWPEGGIATISAQTVDDQNNDITVEANLTVTGPTIAAWDTLDGWQIPFGAFRDFTLTVADTFSHSLVAGTSVLIGIQAFNPRGAAIEGAILTGEGTAEPVVLTECDPKTEFNVRVFNYISGLELNTFALSAAIESPNGNRQVITNGRGRAQVLSTELSRVVLAPEEIVADGDAATIVRITLYDTLGIAIQNVPPDNVVVDVIGGEAVVIPPANPTDEFGRVTASITGREIGQAVVEVRVNDDLLDDQPILNLTPGAPALMNVQVLNRRLEVGGDTTTVVVDVTDANGNPTADGTVVTFEVDDGTLSPASTVTTDGRATTVLSSGITAGTVQIDITATRRGAIVFAVASNIQYTPGPPAAIAISAPTFSVLVASQTDITITATDEFGNAVAGGTVIDLEVSPDANGDIAPVAAQTDTTGVATATFTAGIVAGQQARILATSGDAAGQSSLFTFSPGLPGRITLEANPEDQTVGEDVDLTATVLDSYGNPVNDSTRVIFTLNPQGGIVTPSAIRTTNGVALSLLTGVTESGDVEVNATSSDISASALVTFEVGPLATVSLSAQPAIVLVGNSSTLTATASDQYGNAISGITMNFIIETNPGGDCRLQNAERQTGVAGTATTIFTAGQTTGSAIVTVFFDADGDDQLDNDEINSSTFVDIGQQQ